MSPRSLRTGHGIIKQQFGGKCRKSSELKLGKIPPQRPSPPTAKTKVSLIVSLPQPRAPKLGGSQPFPISPSLEKGPSSHLRHNVTLRSLFLWTQMLGLNSCWGVLESLLCHLTSPLPISTPVRPPFLSGIWFLGKRSVLSSCPASHLQAVDYHLDHCHHALFLEMLRLALC